MSLNLVNYSDSSSEEEVEEPIAKPPIKNKLPNPFGKSSDNNPEITEDSTEHDGRTRMFPHERGNWVTYVYVHCELTKHFSSPNTDSISTLQNELLNVIKSENSLGTFQFHPIEELHLSLTRTVVLRHHWIDEFIRSIENGLRNENKFWIHLNSIKVYCNDNQTRTFISLSLAEMCSNTKQDLHHIVKQLDSCLAEFKLAPFYEEASFHISLLWCLGDRRDELNSLLPQFCSLLERLSAADDSNFAIFVEQLFCKIGNKLYKFQL